VEYFCKSLRYRSRQKPLQKTYSRQEKEVSKIKQERVTALRAVLGSPLKKIIKTLRAEPSYINIMQYIIGRIAIIKEVYR